MIKTGGVVKQFDIAAFCSNFIDYAFQKLLTFITYITHSIQFYNDAISIETPRKNKIVEGTIEQILKTKKELSLRKNYLISKLTRRLTDKPRLFEVSFWRRRVSANPTATKRFEATSLVIK